MKTYSNTIYTVRTKIEPAYEDEFNEWQNEEHVPWLLEMKGYICCQRFIHMKKKYRYMNLWEIECIENHDSPEKVKVSNTPWGKRLRRYRKLQVDFYSNAYSNEGVYPGIESGKALKYLFIDRINYKANAEKKISHWFNYVYFPKIAKVKGVIGIRILNSLKGSEEHKLIVLHYLWRMEENLGYLRKSLFEEDMIGQKIELKSEEYRPLSPKIFKKNNK